MSVIAPQAQLTPPAQPQNTPAPGGPAPLPAPTTTVGAGLGVPRTTTELRDLRNLRDELSDQLRSAAGRRENLVGELANATGPNKAGIEARIQLLDQRILQIEGEIARTGQLVAAARGSQLVDNSPVTRVFGMNENIVVPVMGMLSVFVFAPIAVAFARNMWRRGSNAKVETPLERENSDRLSRLESAVDAIAIEMERVSEGQRFVTKLLAETQGRDKVRLESGRE